MLTRVLSVIFLSATLLFLPVPLLSQGKTLKKILVGVPAVSMGNIIIFATKEARLFEKHGLDAEVIVMQGSGIASRALVAGSVQISPIATPTVISADLAGADMVILAHTMPGVVQSLMVRPEIKRAEDLKGMRTSFEYVALTRPEVWNHKAEEFVDPSIVAELDKSGFIKSLYEK